MPEIEELRKLVEEELGEAGKIDEHVHIPTIVATIRLVGERIVAMEERISKLESNQELLRRFTPGL